MFVTFNESGSITLVTGSPATGTLVGGSTVAGRASLAAGATVALSGTYNATTSTFALSGGGYTVNATVGASSQVTGTISTAAAPAGGTLAAQLSASAASVKNYCGRFTQTNQQAGTTPESGTLNITINNTVIRGAAVQTAGNGASPNSIILSGTFTNGIINVSWLSGYGTASGVLNPNPVGTWQNQDGVSGAWYGNPC